VGAAMACKRLGLPYVLTFSADLFLERAFVGHPLKGLHAKIAARQARFTYDLAKKILCVSEPAKQHLVDNWQVSPEKIVVMPNGVDINLFKPGNSQSALRSELGLNGHHVISFVGGFQPWHGLDILVESFAMCLKEVPTAKLLLVGVGRARDEVEKSIKKFGVEANVIITGFVSQQRVPDYLAVSDLAVMPYPELPKELWFSPLKMYEYMSAGKAIVASSAGQIAEVIHDGENGILVEPGNQHDLARALIRLLQNPDERTRLGATARRQAVEHHSWDQYVRKLEKVYRDVIETSKVQA
jgi:glycosyltransferase involved in cell wall biosynthesis